MVSKFQSRVVKWEGGRGGCSGMGCWREEKDCFFLVGQFSATVGRGNYISNKRAVKSYIIDHTAKEKARGQ